MSLEGLVKTQMQDTLGKSSQQCLRIATLKFPDDEDGAGPGIKAGKAL